MTDKKFSIIYTLTDEAPALATYSLLPIIEAFSGTSGVPIETRDMWRFPWKDREWSTPRVTRLVWFHATAPGW